MSHPSRYSHHFSVDAWGQLAWETFGAEYADLPDDLRVCILRDIDEMLADENPDDLAGRVRQYRSDIGRGNLSAYALTQDIRFNG